MEDWCDLKSGVGCWVTNRSGWLLELLTELIKTYAAIEVKTMRKITVFILKEYPVQSKTQTKKTAFGLQVINSILLTRIVIDDLQITNTRLAAKIHIMKNFTRIAIVL